MDELNNDIQLKDVLIKFSEYKKELWKKRLKIGLTSLLFLILGVLIGIYSEPRYEAELTFVVEKNQGSVSLSGISGIASQFGFDLGGQASEGAFSQQNIIELLKSQGVIYSTLSAKKIIDGSSDFLIQHYLRINNIDLVFDEKNQNTLEFSENAPSIQNDSIKSIVWQEIVEDKLTIDLKDEDANIIALSYVSSNERFAKIFSETLIDQMRKMYVEYQTTQSRRTLNFLESRADSVFLELEKAEEEYARVKDVNQRIVKASGRLKELRLYREVEVLNTMYLEIVKNLELAKMTLLNQTPIILTLDKPILPLEETRIPTLLWVIIMGLIGATLSILFFLFSKLFQDALDSS